MTPRLHSTLPVVNIWLFWAKGVNCCGEIRGILNSGPDGGSCPPGNGPCRGFSGDCGAIKSQFKRVPIYPDFPKGLSGYKCHAFPNKGDGSLSRDTVIVALISYACMLPVATVLAAFFKWANSGKPHAEGRFLEMWDPYVSYMKNDAQAQRPSSGCKPLPRASSPRCLVTTSCWP